MIRVIVADDHPLVRGALEHLLGKQADMEVVASCENGDSLLEALSASPCDAVVLDLSLPDRSGFEVLREVCSAWPSLHVVVYTMYARHIVGGAVHSSGAAALVNKRDPPEDLLRALREPRVAEVEASGPPHLDFTPRQADVFLLLCEGMSPGDIVRRLGVSPSTVSTHMHAIRTRLGVQSTQEILHYALQAGLLDR